MHALHLSDVDAYLCYHDLPGGDPVCVYLHGLGSASSADFPQIARHSLLLPYRALLVDFLGFGFSSHPHPDRFSSTLEAHAATIATLLDHLNLRRCIVIGHSFGGSVAIVLAADRPDLIAKLIVAEPNFEPEDATLSGMIAAQTEKAYRNGGHAALIAEAETWAADDPGMASYVGTLRAADPVVMHRSSASLVAASLGETFFGLGIPRGYLFGSRTLPHSHEALLRANGIPLMAVPEAGHGMMGENPSGTSEAIAAMLPVS
jgi:pimeloyl-ACP methyl ester carboxylesterase